MKKISIKKYTESYFSKFIDLLYNAKSSKISEFYEARLLISKAKKNRRRLLYLEMEGVLQSQIMLQLIS